MNNGGLVDDARFNSIGGMIDETEAEKRQFDFVAKALGDSFSQIDRALTMMRVYPKNHPLVDSLIEQVITKFEPIFDKEEDVVVRIDANQLTSEWGHVIHSKEKAENKKFIWYSAYADGIIQFEFFKGLQANELQRFLWLINQSNQGAISSDDDTVTLLWELQLETIKYFAVEGFVDGGSLDNFDKRTEPEATALIADAAENPSAGSELNEIFSNLNTVHVDLFTRMQIETQMKLPDVELRDQDLEYAFMVDSRTISNVVDEWTSSADLEYRLIEALLSVIRTAPASEGAKKASEIIMAITHQLIDKEMWLAAVKVMTLLSARRHHFTDKNFDPLGVVLDELSDPARLDALLNGFQKNGAQREHLKELLMLLDHDNLQRQIIIILSDPKRDIVGLKWLFLLLKSATNDSNARNIYSPESLKKPEYLKRMLSMLTEKQNAKWPPISRLLLAAIERKEVEIKQMALNIDHSCWKDPRVAEKHLIALSTHEEEDMRKRALKLLGKYHKTLFEKVVKDSVLSKKLGSKSLGEIRFLMRVFLGFSPDSIAELRAILKTRGWGSSHARDFATTAAGVLLKHGDVESRKIIESYQRSLMTNPSLREDYAKLLLRYKVEE